MGAFLSLSTSASALTGPSDTPPPPLRSAPLPPEGRETRRRTGLFKPSLPFIHSTFLHALCLLYTLARATVFCVAQRPDNDGGTLCKIFNVLPFRPSPHYFLRRPSRTLRNSFLSRIPYVSLASFSFSFFFFTPFSCESTFFRVQRSFRLFSRCEYLLIVADLKSNKVYR